MAPPPVATLSCAIQPHKSHARITCMSSLRTYDTAPYASTRSACGRYTVATRCLHGLTSNKLRITSIREDGRRRGRYEQQRSQKLQPLLPQRVKVHGVEPRRRTTCSCWSLEVSLATSVFVAATVTALMVRGDERARGHAIFLGTYYKKDSGSESFMPRSVPFAAE